MAGAPGSLPASSKPGGSERFGGRPQGPIEQRWSPLAVGRRAVSLGRVQTPTLALVARREEEIRNFKPEPYWLVEARFAATGERNYLGRYLGGKLAGRLQDQRARHARAAAAEIRRAGSAAPTPSSTARPAGR